MGKGFSGRRRKGVYDGGYSERDPEAAEIVRREKVSDTGRDQT